MKKLLSVLCAILLVSALTVTAFAEAVPSPGVQGPQVVEIVVTDAEGNVVIQITVTEENAEEAAGYLQLTPMEEKEEASEEVQKALDEAYAAMEEADSLGALFPEYADKEVLDIMHVAFSDEIAEIVAQGSFVDVTTDLKLNLEEGTKLPIIRFIDNEWVTSPDEYAEILADGTVMLHLNQPGVFAILVDPDTERLTEEEVAE